MEQLEEDCEAVLFVLYPPRGALFIPSLEIYFLCREICSFIREGMGMIGESFCIHAGAGNK